jgi:hypothetical protein
MARCPTLVRYAPQSGCGRPISKRLRSCAPSGRSHDRGAAGSVTFRSVEQERRSVLGLRISCRETLSVTFTKRSNERVSLLVADLAIFVSVAIVETGLVHNAYSNLPMLASHTLIFEVSPKLPLFAVSSLYRSFPVNPSSASRTRIVKLPHSRVSCCRNNRALGYQGLSSRSSSQRQSGACVNKIQTGLPNAPARCATLVSTDMTRSSCDISAAVSEKSSSS